MKAELKILLCLEGYYKCHSAMVYLQTVSGNNFLKRTMHIKSILIFRIILLVILSFHRIEFVEAKRVPPRKVDLFVFNDIKFIVPEHKMGYVEAWDIKTQKKLWETKVYEVYIDPGIEPDVQWIYITKIFVMNNKLLVVNEARNIFELDIKTGLVIQPTENNILNGKSWILWSIFVVILFIMFGTLLLMFFKERTRKLYIRQQR